VKRLQLQALVIARRPLGEADLVVTLLTADHGRLEAVAPSGRRSRRRFGGCLEPFGRIEAVLSEARRPGGMWRLEEARSLQPHAAIQTGLVAIAQAAYLCELVHAFTREGEPAGAFLERLERGLGELEAGPLPAAELRRFELDLLGRSGLAPSLAACARCGAAESARWAQDADLTGVLCERCAAGQPLALSAAGLRLLRELQAGRAAPEVPPEAAREGRDALFHTLDRLIGHPFHAREFLRQLAEERTSAPG
jgi:DNA repair protein RecO (recombination protein O)